MEYNKILEECDKHKWWVEEGPATTQFLFYPLRAFITQSKVLHPKFLTVTITGIKNDLFIEITPEGEKYEVYMYVFENMKKDSKYLDKIREENNKKIKSFFEFGDNILEKKSDISNEELCDAYTKFMDLYLDWVGYGAGVECVDIITAYHIEDMVKKELPDASTDDVREVIFALTIPRLLSFMEEERKDFLNSCIEYYDNIDNADFSEHAEKYHFVLNNFKNVEPLDKEHFLAKAKEEVLKDKSKLEKEFESLKNKISELDHKKKEIFEKYDFTDDLKLHFEVIRMFAIGIDERKAAMLKSSYFIEVFCKEASMRFDIDPWDIKYYTFEEYRELLLTGKVVDKDLLEKRRKLSVCFMEKEGEHGVKVKWLYGKEAEQIFDKTLVKATDEIKGQVANSPVPKLTGTVQVIMDVHKESFDEGNILVTSMTRPEFVPLMRKAKAIVTDEGGITCHAAIMSRELGIPCIIGTKNATKTLKDGDVVEIDADKGIVRKI